MDQSTLLKALGAILVSVLAWVAIEIYQDVRLAEERDREMSRRVSEIEGKVQHITELQQTFMRIWFERSAMPRPGEQHPGVGHAE